jgi:hypothetical protein
MQRREFVKAGLLVGGVPRMALGGPVPDVPAHNWDGYDFGPAPRTEDRLDQGPFTIDQDQGWYTIEMDSDWREGV